MRRQRGATLIELVVSVVIISVVVTAMMMLITQTVGRSSDPLMRAQAIAIAEAYMEEILGVSLTDPDGGDVGGPEAGESRATYDDLNDYHNASGPEPATDQYGAAIAGLDAYSVEVTVSGATLNGSPATRVRVEVTHAADADFSLPLVAYRLAQ